MPTFPAKYETSEAPRDRILHEAKKLFASNGFDNTSTNSIARAAKSSESQIIKHFGGKEGLLEAVFDQGWSQIAESLTALEYLSSPDAKLQSLAGLILAKLEDDPELKELFLLEGRRIRKEGHLVLMTQGFLHLVSAIDDLLGQMRRNGQLRPDLHIQGIRSALMGMMEGLLRDRMLAARAGYPASYNETEVRNLFVHVLQSFSRP